MLAATGVSSGACSRNWHQCQTVGLSVAARQACALPRPPRTCSAASSSAAGSHPTRLEGHQSQSLIYAHAAMGRSRVHASASAVAYPCGPALTGAAVCSAAPRLPSWPHGGGGQAGHRRRPRAGSGRHRPHPRPPGSPHRRSRGGGQAAHGRLRGGRPGRGERWHACRAGAGRRVCCHRRHPPVRRCCATHCRPQWAPSGTCPACWACL